MKNNLIKNFLKRKLKRKIRRSILALLGSSFGIAITIIGIMVIAFFGALNYETNEGNSSSSLVGVPQEYIEYFNEASSLTGIPNWVLAGIAKQESNFNPNCEYQGAYGIMQIQKNDFDGSDIWKYYMDYGLGKIYKKAGYNFSSADDMWNKFLKDPKAQIIAGAYETMYYANYVLYKLNLVDKLDYNNVENMKLIDWNANEKDSNFRNVLRRIFACYNGGQGYGMTVDLDNAQNNYPNMVFKYAIEFRENGFNEGDVVSGNKDVETVIKAGEKWVGKSPYIWGGGRTEADVKAGRFDCSSFIHYCFDSAGVKLGDRASCVTFSLVNMGKKINPKDMKRGDVIFFDTYTTNGHVAIWLGNNKFMHDSSSKGVTISDFNDYWRSKFNGNVRRYID